MPSHLGIAAELETEVTLKQDDGAVSAHPCSLDALRRRRRVAFFSLLAGIAVALLTAPRANATVPSDLCTGNPCLITGSHVVDPGSVLDFGAADVRVTGTGVVSVGSGAPGLRAIELAARSIALQPGAQVLGNGGNARVLLEATAGNVEVAAGARIDLRAGAGASGGTAWLIASGNVSVQGDIDVSAAGIDSAGGAIALEAEGAIAVATDLNAYASGVGSAGGEIQIAAGTGVTLGGALDVSSATDAGTIDISSVVGAITAAKRIAADGGNPAGYGGAISIAADYGDVTLSGVVSASGGTGIQEQCGDGGEIAITSGLSVVLANHVTLNGGTHCYAGTLEVAAEGSFTQGAATTISLKAAGEYGQGGVLSVEAFGDVTLRTVDLTSPGYGGIVDAVSRAGRVRAEGTIEARGTGEESGPGAIDLRGCTVEVPGQLDARGPTTPPNTGYVALRASDAMNVGGVLRAASENRLRMRSGAPATAGSTIVPAPSIATDPTIPACAQAAVCGNGVPESGELCDEGAERNGAAAGCCAADCRSAKADGASCDDGLFCNGADTCRSTACVAHEGNPCTTSSGPCASASCSETSHCQQPAGAACDDGDGNPCTDGACDAVGACVASANEASCDDGTYCNGEERCIDGACRRTQRSCPAESCDEGAQSCGSFCGDGEVQEGEECGEPGAGSCGAGEACRDCACETGEIRGDSYVCYGAEPAAVPAWQLTPATFELRDRFETRTYDVSSVASVCSPAVVSSSQGTYPPSFQGIAQVDHATAETALPPQPPFVRTHHAFTDRFGTVRLTLTQPDGLLLRARVADFGPIVACDGAGACGDRTCQSGFCLPDPAAAPKKPPKISSPVDNFKCYKVKIQTGTPRFRKVRGLWVADQLGAVLLYDAVKPLRVCSPASVGGVNATAPGKPGQLTCYKLKRAASQPQQAWPPPRTVGARYRDFRPAFLDLAGAKELCVPSLVDAVP